MMMKALNEAISDKIRRTGGDPSKVENWRPIESEEELRRFAIEFLAKSIPAHTTLMHEKIWVILETTNSDPFWISDNPVTMHNGREFGPYGNIGLAVPGIEIYLPLAPTLTLALWCPTILHQLEEDLRRARQRRQQLSALLALGTGVVRREAGGKLGEYSRVVAQIEELLACISDGSPLASSADNVIFHNSLQVRWSERYVMSSTPDFSLAERMINDSEEFRQGMRLRTE